MTHPLVSQLHFTRSEFWRAVKGISDEDARQRFLPMNCISWNVGHLAWQEQRYFLYYGEGPMLLPEIDKEFAYGAPASRPLLKGDGDRMAHHHGRNRSVARHADIGHSQPERDQQRQTARPSLRRSPPAGDLSLLVSYR